jgi:Uma2 family endonuclease
MRRENMNLASVGKTKEHYTYSDYATWGDDIRCELIDGHIHMMTAPNDAHQSIVLSLGSIFKSKLKGSRCKPYIAPFDVRLNFDTADDIVVQPDLFVVCDRSKLDGKSCLGAPDLVIEILSPSTARNDLLLKYHRYLTAGVLEYWIVHPENRIIDVFVLEGGIYKHTECKDKDTIKSFVLPKLNINLVDVFEEY